MTRTAFCGSCAWRQLADSLQRAKAHLYTRAQSIDDDDELIEEFLHIANSGRHVGDFVGSLEEFKDGREADLHGIDRSFVR